MKERIDKKKRGWENASYVLLAVVLVVGAVVVHSPSKAAERSGGRRVLADFPMTLGEWTGTDVKLSDDLLSVLGADDYLCRQYHRGDQALTLYVTYFGTGNGALTHNPEKCYTASGWAFLDKQTLDMPGTTRQVLLSTVGKGDVRELVMYWYQARERVIVSKLDHISSVLFKALLGGETHSFVALVAQTPPDSDGVTPVDINLDFVGRVMDALANQAVE